MCEADGEGFQPSQSILRSAGENSSRIVFLVRDFDLGQEFAAREFELSFIATRFCRRVWAVFTNSLWMSDELTTCVWARMLVAQRVSRKQAASNRTTCHRSNAWFVTSGGVDKGGTRVDRGSDVKNTRYYPLIRTPGVLHNLAPYYGGWEQLDFALHGVIRINNQYLI